jgi:hypothetical protein
MHDDLLTVGSSALVAMRDQAHVVSVSGSGQINVSQQMLLCEVMCVLCGL